MLQARHPKFTRRGMQATVVGGTPARAFEAEQQASARPRLDSVDLLRVCRSSSTCSISTLSAPSRGVKARRRDAWLSYL
jgi:hypothetical protein